MIPPDDLTTSWWWINWYLFENWNYYNYLHFKKDSAANAQSLSLVYIVIAVIDQSQAGSVKI